MLRRLVRSLHTRSAIPLLRVCAVRGFSPRPLSFCHSCDSLVPRVVPRPCHSLSHSQVRYFAADGPEGDRAGSPPPYLPPDFASLPLQEQLTMVDQVFEHLGSKSEFDSQALLDEIHQRYEERLAQAMADHEHDEEMRDLETQQAEFEMRVVEGRFARGVVRLQRGFRFSVVAIAAAAMLVFLFLSKRRRAAQTQMVGSSKSSSSSPGSWFFSKSRAAAQANVSFGRVVQKILSGEVRVERVVVRDESVVFFAEKLEEGKGKRAGEPVIKKEQVRVYMTRKTFEKKWAKFKERHGSDLDALPPIFYNSQPLPSAEKNAVGTLIVVITVLGLMYLLRDVGRTRESMGQAISDMDIFASKVKKVDLNMVSTRFADVAGLHEQKIEVMEFVDFVKDRQKFDEIGCTLPRGLLLTGPPGTGKTLLAKAVAGECDVPFFTMAGTEFVEVIVGVGAQRVRDLFEEARENQPCIVFIDEIDAVGSQRGSGQFLGRNDERENTLNQLLIEMDGFTPNDNIVVMAATNRPQILDTALLRSGRFDRHIEISMPDFSERKEVFQIYLDKVLFAGEMDEVATALAHLTPGCSGADIANICNEGALRASRNSSDAVTLSDFENSIDKIIGGLERTSMAISPHERESVAVHEAGHAVVSWMLDNCDPPVTATIVPRSSGALGFTRHLPRDRRIETRDELEAHVCCLLAGRGAEKLCFDELSTGAVNDLSVTTNLVYSMATSFGMFPEEIGHLSFPSNPHILEVTKPYSEETSRVIDETVEDFVKEMNRKTMEILTVNEDKVVDVAELLLENDTIHASDLVDVIGHGPKSSTKEFEEYLRSTTDK